MPVLKWLMEQPLDKMHVIKILNIPIKATEAMLIKWINKNIKDFKYDKIKLEVSP